MSAGLFDVLGPITVGPSSSHTAGAIRIGLIARMLLGENIKTVKITFFGSFAETYKGHGTDKAVLGGLLGFSTDNERIRDSLSIASEKGIDYEIIASSEPSDHPNTVRIEARGESSSINVLGVSTGGGAIKIAEIEGHRVEVFCRLDTLVVFNDDQPGVVAAVAGHLSSRGYNISNLILSRDRKAGSAIMVIETDVPVDDLTFDSLAGILHVRKIIRIPKI